MTKVNFHEFTLGDVEDPGIFAEIAISNWLATEHGSWVQKHAHNLIWGFTQTEDMFGHLVRINGELTDQDATVYYLKYGSS